MLTKSHLKLQTAFVKMDLILYKPRGWKIFPNSKVIFDFYIQRLELPVIQFIHLFAKTQTQVLYIVCGHCKVCHLPNWKNTDLLELI